MTGWGDAPSWRALVVAEPAAFRDAEEAAGLAGGRAERLDWRDAATLAERPLDWSVLVIEAEGVAPPLLAAGLSALAEAADAAGRPIVASFAARDLDAVAGVLLGHPGQLLCEPSLVERVAALAIAARHTEAEVEGLVAESDRDRLGRLNAEIARIAELLARISAESGGGRNGADAVDDRRASYDSGPGVDMVDPAAIRQAIRTRRLRDGFFPAGLFEDPAWDMLLDLFAAELEGNRVSVSSLCIAAAVAPTTALRWIARMTEVGLLKRMPDPQDRRRAFMALTDVARAGMRSYLAAVSRAGLAIA